MASYPVLGSCPVTYLDANQAQRSIPLAAISIADGVASATQWPGWTTSPDQTLITAVLAQLVNQGLLQPGTVPAQPALTITAVETGPAGNIITVTFSNPDTTVTPATVDVEVTATQVNAGLTLTGSTGLAAVLGNSQASATGLIYLSGAVGANLPAALASTALPPTGKLQINDTTSPTPGVSFSVKAAVGAPTDISVSVTDVTATTFTLTAVWTLTATVTLATLTGGGNPFSALVTFSAPPNGSVGALPAGSVTLVGGAAASSSSAVAAAAVALSA
jgi:hypothetical protein